MKEKLIIRNFGPIKDVELELGKFNILIGEQATGKTMVAKVLACCRYFSYIARLNDGGIEQAFVEWGMEDCLKLDTQILYSNEDYNIEIKYEKVLSEVFGQDGEIYTQENGNFKIYTEAISEKLKRLFLDLSQIKPNDFDRFLISNNDEWAPPISFFKNNVASVIDNPFYIPTERGLQSIFSLGKSSIQNIDDALFNQFAKVDQIQRLFKTETEIEPLGILYKNENGYGLFRKKNDSEWYKMGNAPSGFKTTIPIVLTIKSYSELQEKRKFFIVDEPEISLFPTTQFQLVKFFARSLNEGNQFLITTHSPYILTSLNNLMYAFQVGKINEDEVDAILPKKNWINPEDVSAYMMLPNGTCKSILDKEGLIKTENIDGVSADLNKQFNLIMDIEIGVEK